MDSLQKKIYRLHIDIVRELNDSSIFIQKTREILQYETSNMEESVVDKAYSVPAKKGKVISKEAWRTDTEVKNLLTRIIDTDLFENALITNVSKFESYLFKTIAEVIYRYPEKLGINVSGVKPYKSIPIELITESNSMEEIVKSIVADRINGISYCTPQQYLSYFQEVTGCNTNADEFKDYIEIKATRDILVHNDKKISQVYLDKVGIKSRGNLNQTIAINSSYFDLTIATMKRISGIIRREIVSIQ